MTGSVVMKDLLWSGVPVETWRPARKYPETYPGESVGHSYLLWGNRVLPISSGQAGEFSLAVENETILLDELLRDLGLPGLKHRFPVLSYGANRNPSTLYTKLRNYSSAQEAMEHCLPVLKGQMTGADVAACRFHGHGYLYGELLLGLESCRNVELEVYVCLADLEQLAIINKSEGVDTGLYSLVLIPDVQVDGVAEGFFSLGYAAEQPVWHSPVHGSPVSYSLLPAEGRSLPSMTTSEMVDHVLGSLGLRGDLSRLTGLENDELMAEEVMKYLNGQWWYQFHTGASPIRGYSRALELLDLRMAQNSAPSRTLDHLRKNGLLLPQGDAYAPDRKHLWGNTVRGL